MTGVLLRCPNCGTTKSSFGECEACHEAQVRYYCTNHTPGQWLEAPKCTLCGAVFGRASPGPAPSPIPAPRPERGPTRAAPAPTRPAPRAPRPDGSRIRDRDDSDRHRAEPGRRDTEEPRELRRGGGVLLPSLEEILRAAARRRVPREPAPEREAVPVRRGMGCFTRLLLMALFFILSLVASLFVTAGSVFQMFRF
jgi:rubredoxin